MRFDHTLVNRELSWLDFNTRVLDLADDSATPLLKRLKFLAISASNLDEFYQVRLGALNVLRAEKCTYIADEPYYTVETLRKALKRSLEAFTDRQYALFARLETALRAQHIRRYTSLEKLSEAQQRTVRNFIRNEIVLQLSLQMLDLKHVPMIRNLGLHMLVEVDDAHHPYRLLPLHRIKRFLFFKHKTRCSYMCVEDAVRASLKQLLGRTPIRGAYMFRLARNGDFTLRENELPDALYGMELLLKTRHSADTVLLEYASDMPKHIVHLLKRAFACRNTFFRAVNGPLGLHDFMQIAALDNFAALHDPPFEPARSPALSKKVSLFKAMAARDHVLVLPYERFDPVAQFIEEAAEDKQVTAIKQTLYRIGEQSSIIKALINAAKNGKNVTVLLELKARFDEERNMLYAEKMEHYGIQVIYGLPEYKVHGKMCLVIRREKGVFRRYLHLSTGNYNSTTARLYSDISFFTCNAQLCRDAGAVFNSVCAGNAQIRLPLLCTAPTALRAFLLAWVNEAQQAAQNGQACALNIKLNALSDPEMVQALCRAGCAGVKIRLNIRGICTLIPGITGVSENIRVVSIVDYFLEHARILEREINGVSTLYLSSADWMPRNLDRRVEFLFPIEDAACKAQISELLHGYFCDNTQSWELDSTGVYHRLHPAPGEREFRIQKKLITAFKKRSRQSASNSFSAKKFRIK